MTWIMLSVKKLLLHKNKDRIRVQKCNDVSSILLYEFRSWFLDSIVHKEAIQMFGNVNRF